MELTRRNKNTPTRNTPVSNLATWGPLISRLTKMAVEYAQSNARKGNSQNGVGSPAFSTQYSYGGTTRRGKSRKSQPKGNREGIPSVVGLKIHPFTVTGSILLQSNNGSQAQKWYLGDLVDTDDLLINASASVKSFLRAFKDWKYQRVVITFETCLGATDGGYHAGVAQSALNTLATVTPYEIGQISNSQTKSLRSPITLTLVPSHNNGIIHYNESLNSNEPEERKTGTIMYYVAGGAANTQPIAMATYTVNMLLWND